MNPVVEADLERLLSDDHGEAALRGKTVLIIGANSLIGKWLAWYLLRLRARIDLSVVLLARNRAKFESAFAGYRESRDYTLINQDICEPVQYTGAADYIFDAAGNASAWAIAHDPTGIIRANALGTQNVLDLAKARHTERVVFCSTREVYGRVANTGLIDETMVGVLDQLDPRSCYPESKRLAEGLLVAYSRQFGVSYTNLRIAHTYGPKMALQQDGRVMADLIAGAVAKGPIRLNSDGTAVRSFAYITDMLDGALRAMLMGDANETFNLANETEPHMIRDVAGILARLFTREGVRVEFTTQSDPALSSGYSKLPTAKADTSKLESLGWRPVVPLAVGLKRTVESFWAEEP